MKLTKMKNKSINIQKKSLLKNIFKSLKKQIKNPEITYKFWNVIKLVVFAFFCVIFIEIIQSLFVLVGLNEIFKNFPLKIPQIGFDLIPEIIGSIGVYWVLDSSIKQLFGISEIPKLPLSTFVDNIKFAKHIRILETFTDLANNDILFEKFSEAIKEALSGKSRIEILLIHPESEAAKQRAEELSRAIQPINNVPELIEKTLARFYRLETEKVGEDKIGTLEIKLYDAFPTIAMHKWDQEAYISFYPVNQRSDEAPNLKVSTLTTFGSYAASKFDELWLKDSAIPLYSYMMLRVEVENEPEQLFYYAFEKTNKQFLYASCKFKDSFFSALDKEKSCVISFGKDKYDAEHSTLRLLDEKVQAIELISKRYDWKDQEKYIGSDPRVFQIKLLHKKTN